MPGSSCSASHGVNPNLKKSKIQEQKNITNFLNGVQDENKFWHRYSKLLEVKNNNIEPIFDETTNEYIFQDSKISEKLIQHHIEKISKRSYNAPFKKKT